MSETLKCSSCGGSNKLPEGKNSMFCAFCGNAIEKEIKASKNDKESTRVLLEKPTISKPKVEIVETYKKLPGSKELTKERKDNGWEVTYSIFDKITTDFFPDKKVSKGGGELSLTGKGIKSLEDITHWFTDSELLDVKTLILNGNKLVSLDGIGKFKKVESISITENNIESVEINGILSNLRSLSLNGNPIKTVKQLPEVRSSYGDGIGKVFRLNLSNCGEIEFSELAQKQIANFFIGDINEVNIIIDDINNSDSINSLIKFVKNDNTTPGKLKISSTSETLKGLSWSNVTKSAYEVYTKKYYTDTYTCNSCGVVITENTYNSKGGICAQCENKKSLQLAQKKGNCFIATATMGSYDHPQVMELRNFRDEWILQKKWGEKFVKWYYHYGAIAAKFIEKSFVLKKLSYLLIVKPFVYLSRIVNSK